MAIWQVLVCCCAHGSSDIVVVPWILCNLWGQSLRRRLRTLLIFFGALVRLVRAFMRALNNGRSGLVTYGDYQGLGRAQKEYG